MFSSARFGHKQPNRFGVSLLAIWVFVKSVTAPESNAHSAVSPVGRRLGNWKRSIALPQARVLMANIGDESAKQCGCSDLNTFRIADNLGMWLTDKFRLY